MASSVLALLLPGLPAQSAEPVAALNIQLLRDGSVDVILPFERADSSFLDFAENLKSLGGCALDAGRYGSICGYHRWRCAHALTRRGFLAEGRLDLAAPAAALKQRFSSVLISVQVPKPARWSADEPGWRAADKGSLTLLYSGDREPPPLTLRSGIAGVEWIRQVGPLTACMAIPLLLAAAYRPRALRLAAGHRGGELFTFITWFGWVAAAAEFACFFLGFFNEDLPAVLSAGNSVGHPLARGALVALPALVVAGGCTALLMPVYRFWNAPEVPTSEILTFALLRRALYLVPVGCIVGAIVNLDPAVATASIAAAYASGGLIWFTLNSRLGVVPVQGGEFHTRMLQLAGRAGVKLRGLLILRRLPVGRANAFAMRGGHVIFTQELLEKLSRREVDAVMAHELGHLKGRHINARAILVFAVVALLGMAQFVPAFRPYLYFAAPALGAAAIALFLMLSRHQERGADRDSVRFSGDPEAMISALSKLMRLNNLPLQWGSGQGRLLTHPSVMERAEWIAKVGGIPPERARQVAENGLADEGDRYPLPELGESHNGVFSDSMRRGVALFVVWSRRIAAVAVPLALGGFVFGEPWQFQRILVSMLAAAPVFFAIQIVLDAMLGRAPYPLLKRRLQQSLEREGVMVSGQPATFIGYSPGRSALVFGSFDFWDIGFVWTAGDRMVVAGDRTRFTLRRDQVAEIRLGRGLPGAVRYRRVYLVWREEAGGPEKVLNLRPCEGWTALRDNGRAKRLARELEEWKSGAAASAATAPEYGPPRLEDVHGVPIRELVRWRFVLRELVTMQVLAILATSVAQSVYAVFAALYPPLTVLLTRLPVLLSRKRPGARHRSGT